MIFKSKALCYWDMGHLYDAFWELAVIGRTNKTWGFEITWELL
jgi:hypothetical protein